MRAFIAYFVFIMCLFGILQWGIVGIIISVIIVIVCILAIGSGKRNQMQKELDVEKKLAKDEWDIVNISIETHKDYLNKKGGEEK